MLAIALLLICYSIFAFAMAMIDAETFTMVLIVLLFYTVVNIYGIKVSRSIDKNIDEIIKNARQ